MPWCPKCGLELVEGDSCPECGGNLVPTVPQAAESKHVDKFWSVADTILAVVLVTVVHCAAALASVMARGYSDALMVAIQMGVFCLGGICFAFFRPTLRVGTCFVMWAVPPAIFFAVALVSLIRAPDFVLPDLMNWDTVYVVIYYLLVPSAIGAVATTIASRWFLGQGRKHFLALLAVMAVFISTPFAVAWLVSRLCR